MTPSNLGWYTLGCLWTIGGFVWIYFNRGSNFDMFSTALGFVVGLVVVWVCYGVIWLVGKLRRNHIQKTRKRT